MAKKEGFSVYILYGQKIWKDFEIEISVCQGWRERGDILADKFC